MAEASSIGVNKVWDRWLVAMPRVMIELLVLTLAIISNASTAVFVLPMHFDGPVS